MVWCIEVLAAYRILQVPRCASVCLGVPRCASTSHRMLRSTKMIPFLEDDPVGVPFLPVPRSLRNWATANLVLCQFGFIPTESSTAEDLLWKCWFPVDLPEKVHKFATFRQARLDLVSANVSAAMEQIYICDEALRPARLLVDSEECGECCCTWNALGIYSPLRFLMILIPNEFFSIYIYLNVRSSASARNLNHSAKYISAQGH